jgi:hypothetical protein
LTFFGLQDEKGGSRADAAVSFDITPTVRALQARGLWKENEATVTFVLRTLEDGEGRALPVSPELRARVANIKITVAPRE